MLRYFVEISYHGKGYNGWQKQPNAATVQQTIEDCLFKLFGNKAIETVGCGRTDTGVHAHRFFLHFDVEVPIWDLNKFLGVVSMFSNPDLEFHDNHVVVSNGRSSVTYYYSEPSLLTVPTRELKMPKTTIKFDLDEIFISCLEHPLVFLV